MIGRQEWGAPGPRGMGGLFDFFWVCLFFWLVGWGGGGVGGGGEGGGWGGWGC